MPKYAKETKEKYNTKSSLSISFDTDWRDDFINGDTDCIGILYYDIFKMPDHPRSDDDALERLGNALEYVSSKSNVELKKYCVRTDIDSDWDDGYIDIVINGDI